MRGSANFPGWAAISSAVIRLSPYSCLNLMKPAPSTVLGRRALLTTPTFALNEITGFPVFPFFVVMATTPLAAFAPYTATELASFSTSMFSISIGLMSCRDPS